MSTTVKTLSVGTLEDHIARTLPMVRSVLVSRHGRIEYERYFADAKPDERVNIWSSTKSVTSMLVGILHKDGDFPPLDAKITDLLPALAERAHPTFRTATIRHCLTMTLGYHTELGDHNVTATIRRPVDVAPGQQFDYNDVGTHIISRLITERTGMSASAFANARLFGPLGIVKPPWRVAADGFPIGGYGLLMTPHEMMRFGEFALRSGEWNGEQLVDPSFFAESVKIQADGGFPGNDRYGFLWWVSERNGQQSFYSLGYGGQLVCVTPALDLVAVITCTDELGAYVEPAQAIYFDHIMQWEDYSYGFVASGPVR